MKITELWEYSMHWIDAGARGDITEKQLERILDDNDPHDFENS